MYHEKVSEIFYCHAVIGDIQFISDVIYLTILYFSYIRVNMLSIALVRDIPVNIDVPVKYRHDFPTDLPGVSIRTKKNKRYGLRCDLEKKEIFITIVRAGVLYGYMESYEITDPKVRAELIELFKKAWQEEEKIRQRFKNNG